MTTKGPAPCMKVQANPWMRARFKDGRLASLKAQKQKAIEFISQDAPFGDIMVTLDVGGESKALSTAGLAPSDAGEGAAFDLGPLSVSLSFSLSKEKLAFRMALKNTAPQPIRLLDLSVPFSMNSRFDWGVKAQERVIRHSFVSGDGSFLYFTPCDGEPPFLVCCPTDGTRLEMYDARIEQNGQRVYRAFIHAAGEEEIAREKGCAWRQPVSDKALAPGETAAYGFDFSFAAGYDGVRDALYEAGKPDIIIAPGMTLPRGQKARVRIRLREEIRALEAEFPGETVVKRIAGGGDAALYDISFLRLGENRLTLLYGKNKYCVLEFFSTLPVERLIAFRGAFIAAHQIRDESKWYDGLLAEWNNETGALLSPDNYDNIKGWRIYEVTCDDPGLSKPAFLSGKNAEFPVKEEVEALEYYIARFVWGGLQRRDTEEYPYGIYGIPDWKTLRDSADPGVKGRAHLWRIYDYPHLALTYFNLYRIGRAIKGMLTYETPLVYLERAYRTFLALYQYPLELTDWSPYKTGLYNELVIADVISALESEGRTEAAQRLRFHWQRKAKFFITACEDVFGSEYPFDTTGYESTQALSDWGRKTAAQTWQEDKRSQPDFAIDQVEQFALYQTQCNVACRGVMEHAYYLLGSDYRGCSAHYTLSYMSQMGGWSLLSHALYSEGNPFPLLRLAYASLLSSWALMNAGDEEGYWFPGKEHNGAAGGGFENAPYGETWLDQPHHRGSWNYSCEIDLGFCGALRGAATILAEDPELGIFCYGGTYENSVVLPKDGVRRRFHHIKKDARLHVLIENARILSITLDNDGAYRIALCGIVSDARAEISISGEYASLTVRLDDEQTKQTGAASFSLPLPAHAKTVEVACGRDHN